MVEVKVAGPYLEAAEALMRAKGAALGNDDTPLIDGKPLSDYIREWAASDAGKAFVSAPNSSGGGASGGSAASGSSFGNMGGSPAERQAAIAQKFKLPT